MFLGPHHPYRSTISLGKGQVAHFPEADLAPLLSELLGRLTWAFTTGYDGNWHPLSWLSHILDVKRSGLNAGWHHLTSRLLHVAKTLLLFLVLKHMTGALWRGAFVAALFALHPLHVESVAWIAERKDVLRGR